jgi:hypothetical protein
MKRPRRPAPFPPATVLLLALATLACEDSGSPVSGAPATDRSGPDPALNVLAARAEVCGVLDETLVITENTRLTCDVQCGSMDGPCIRFGRDNITLFLNGFTVTGPAEPPSVCAVSPAFGPPPRWAWNRRTRRSPARGAAPSPAGRTRAAMGVSYGLLAVGVTAIRPATHGAGEEKRDSEKGRKARRHMAPAQHPLAFRFGLASQSAASDGLCLPVELCGETAPGEAPWTGGDPEAKPHPAAAPASSNFRAPLTDSRRGAQRPAEPAVPITSP